jgi:hypothetical protein
MLDLRLTVTEDADGRLVLATPIAQTAILAVLAAATLVAQFFMPGVSWLLLLLFVVFAAGALFHERWEFDVPAGRVARCGGFVPFRTMTELAPEEVEVVLLELFTVGRSTSPSPDANLEAERGRREGPFGSKHYCRLALVLDEAASGRLGRNVLTVEAIKARGVDQLHAAAARIAEVLGARLEIRQ